MLECLSVFKRFVSVPVNTKYNMQYVEKKMFNFIFWSYITSWSDKFILIKDEDLSFVTSRKYLLKKSFKVSKLLLFLIKFLFYCCFHSNIETQEENQDIFIVYLACKLRKKKMID